MDYIKDLRSLIGNKPIILSVCGCLIFDEFGKVLLQKRSDNNLFGNPGGCMELGETIEECVKREVLEETGLVISDLELFKIYSGNDQHHIYPNGDEVYFVNIIFKTSKYTGVLKKHNLESLEIKFVDINNLPKNLTPPFVPVAKDLRKIKEEK